LPRRTDVRPTVLKDGYVRERTAACAARSARRPALKLVLAEALLDDGALEAGLNEGPAQLNPS
jgi:hypothetical protein